MNSAADRFFCRVAASPFLQLCPIGLSRQETLLGFGNQSVNHPRIALSDEGLELGFHLPGGERGAAAGTQAGSPW